jgi:AraC-like DNA-binding protein
MVQATLDHQDILLRNNPRGNRGILAAAATGLADFILHQDGDPDRVFGRSGINPECLGHPTSSLGLVAYCRALEEAAHSSECDHFGLYYGRQFKPQSLGLIGYIGLCSATLEQALRHVALDFSFHQHHTLTRFVDLGSCFRLEYQVRHGAIPCRRQDAELTMGMFMNLIRHVLGPAWGPLEVHLEHPKPIGWQEHAEVYNAPVRFDQPCNALVLPKQDLQRPMPQSDPLLLLLMREAIRQLNVDPVSQSLADQVRAQIQQALREGEPKIEQVAERLDISATVLQRRLRREGVTFIALVDQVRSTLARYFLEEGALSVTELALLLGYSETSALSRSFRRWFGMSPQQYRQAHHRATSCAIKA